ncbi:MAG: uncharacterized protein KVP18_004898 [Porospora cf. gigantea A]|uniref:uncharacterized protein n=2 Tax=Porospora cf. gigantea A TaxID=2853593 RepID=UPI00355AB1D7|nr:MAG: hypothetical protein KVP18_004898 [Porospora cf. gigantea A]
MWAADIYEGVKSVCLHLHRDGLSEDTQRVMLNAVRAAPDLRMVMFLETARTRIQSNNIQLTLESGGAEALWVVRLDHSSRSFCPVLVKLEHQDSKKNDVKVFKAACSRVRQLFRGVTLPHIGIHASYQPYAALAKTSMGFASSRLTPDVLWDRPFLASDAAHAHPFLDAIVWAKRPSFDERPAQYSPVDEKPAKRPSFDERPAQYSSVDEKPAKRPSLDERPAFNESFDEQPQRPSFDERPAERLNEGPADVDIRQQLIALDTRLARIEHVVESLVVALSRWLRAATIVVPSSSKRESEVIHDNRTSKTPRR